MNFSARLDLGLNPVQLLNSVLSESQAISSEKERKCLYHRTFVRTK